MFNFFRNSQNVLQSSCSVLHFFHLCLRVFLNILNISTFFSTSWKERNLLSCISLVLIFRTAVKWYLVVVRVCIYLMVNDVECHFIWLLAIYLFKYGLMNIYVLLWVKSSTTYFVAQVEIFVQMLCLFLNWIFLIVES